MPRTWFITGATSGLGREITAGLLARGDRVAATGHRPEQVRTLSALHDMNLWTATLDVTDTQAISDVVDRAFTELERIDVVVSNAGFGVLGAAEEVPDDLLTRQLDVNLTGAIQLARAVIPRMRAQGGGRIIQISSSGGQVPDPGMSLYNATKFGIEGFYESAAIELEPFGIEVTLAEPGGMRTSFNQNIMLAEPLPPYQDGIVGQIRDMLTGHRNADLARRSIIGDPVKIARAIIDIAAETPAPRRVVLGSNAYEAITAALRERLASLEPQRRLAYSTDADDAIAARDSAY